MKIRFPLFCSLLAFFPLSIPAALLGTQELAQDQDRLESPRQQSTGEHPKVKEQQLRIEQLQRRFETEPRETRQPVIRTTLKIRSAKPDGEAAELLTSPTLVTQAGQVARTRVGALTVTLTSSADEQNTITSAIELTGPGPDKLEKTLQLPLITSRPGEPASARVEDFTVEIVANLLEPKGIDVDFPGGSLGQLLASLNTTGSRPFNLIASQDVLAQPLPAFKLRNVEPRDLALAIDWFLDGYIVDIPADKPDRAGLPVFTVRVNNKANQRQAEEPAKPERFKSFPVFMLKNQFPVEEVVAALHAAWALDPTHRPEALHIKYHAPTGILLISSREEAALEVVDQVMISLVSEAEHGPSPTP